MATFENNYPYIFKPIKPAKIALPNYNDAFVQENSSVDTTEAQTFLSFLSEGLKFVSDYSTYLYTNGDDGEYSGNYAGSGIAGAYDAEGNLRGESFLSGTDNLNFNLTGNDFALFDDLTTTSLGASFSDPLSADLYNQWVSFSAVDYSGDWSTYAQPVMDQYLSQQNVYELILSGGYQSMSKNELYGFMLALTEMKRRFTYAMCSMFGPFSALGTYNSDGSIEYVDDETMINQIEAFWEEGGGKDLDYHNKKLLAGFLKIQSNLKYYFAATFGEGSYEGLSDAEASAFQEWHTFLNDTAGSDFENWQDDYDTEMGKAEEDRNQTTIQNARNRICFYQEFFGEQKSGDTFYSDSFSGAQYAKQPYLVTTDTPQYSTGWDEYSAGLEIAGLSNTNATPYSQQYNDATEAYSSWGQVYGYSTQELKNDYQNNWVMKSYGILATNSQREVTRVVNTSMFNSMRSAAYNIKKDAYDSEIQREAAKESFDKKLENKAAAKRRSQIKGLQKAIAKNHQAVQARMRQAGQKAAAKRKQQANQSAQKV